MAMMSAYAPTVLMVSMTLSPLVVELSDAEAKPNVVPPSSSIAASKLSLVRVDGSKNSVAIFFPSHAWAYFSRCAMMSSATAIKASISSVVKSDMSNRCLILFTSKPRVYLRIPAYEARIVQNALLSYPALVGRIVAERNELRAILSLDVSFLDGYF